MLINMRVSRIYSSIHFPEWNTNPPHNYWHPIKKIEKEPHMSDTTSNNSLRKHLTKLLESSEAHTDFETAFKKLPLELQGKKPEGADHSAWELLEHMRIAQWDIVEFTRNPKHKSPEFPKGYWPKKSSPPDDAAWGRTVKAFQSDLKAMVEIVTNPAHDLFAEILHGDGQTILREVLVLADHNAYHLGQLVQLRKQLGAWE
ncbi:MAG TPA: DinB family protein [Terriglobales bacterium]|nr:DinB family protein [Terriglobales bacterium]